MRSKNKVALAVELSICVHCSALFFNNTVSYVHVVISAFKMLIYSCLSKKSPTGLTFHVVYYSTKNKISMSMSATCMGMWNRAFGMLQAGMTQTHVAKQIWTSLTDIHRLSSRFALLVICADQQRSRPTSYWMSTVHHVSLRPLSAYVYTKVVHSCEQVFFRSASESPYKPCVLD